MRDESLFASIAIQEGFLTAEQIDAARRDLNGRSLEELLLDRRLLTESQVRTIEDIRRIHLAEASPAGESGGVLREDRYMLPCSGCDTYYIIQDHPEGTRFACRKCNRVLTVRREGRPPHPPAPSTPPAVGPYDIGKEIGRGSIGVIYRATDRRTGESVALKILKPQDSLPPETLRRFRLESQAVRRLSHPHIVPVRDAGEVDGQAYIAMDLVEGVTLDTLLAEARMPLRDVVALLEKVALALHHVHDLGIVHRDLKPANILVDAAGEPRIADFGLAKLADTEQGVTHAGTSLGTPFYMSPEQVKGDVAGTDGRSDVYSLGVLLYEAMTGQVPFPERSVFNVYRRILSDDPPPPRDLNPAAPADLEATALKALSRRREDRHASAREFAAELRRHLEGGR